MAAEVSYLSGPLADNFGECMKVYGDTICLVKDGVPIISVGCGNGYFESLQQVHRGRDIYGADPNPNAFQKVPDEIYNKSCLKPITTTLQTGALDKYRGQAFLILNWSPPQTTWDIDGASSGMRNFDPKEANFDIAAIYRMMPVGFFVTYAPCGGSGSEELCELLYDENITISDGVDDDEIEYMMVSRFTNVYGSGGGFSGKTYRAVGYVRNDMVPDGYVAHDMFVESEYTELCNIM